jgi:two-component system, NarL family, sensor kinase
MFQHWFYMPKEVSEITIAILAGTLVLVILGLFIVNFLLIHNKRSQQHYHEKQQLESRFQQELLKSQLEIKENTLQNISQEIHDNIGQVLSLVKLNLGNINTGSPDLLMQKIEDSYELVGKAIHDLRYLSKSMNTDYVTDMGLLRAVEHEVEMIQKSGAFSEVALHVDGEPLRLDPQIELILFRIVQEIISNIIRHAKASDIAVNVSYNDPVLKITITDNGCGFDLGPFSLYETNQFGLGIRNMHTRAHLVGATFSMMSTIGQGTTAIICLPLPIPE